MQITKTDDQLDIRLNLDELSWLGQVLNECCNGFRIGDFESKIGVDRNTAIRLLDKIVAMYPATLSGD